MTDLAQPPPGQTPRRDRRAHASAPQDEQNVLPAPPPRSHGRRAARQERRAAEAHVSIESLESAGDDQLRRSPRGRRATSYGQNFVPVVLWSIAGALIPGVGLIAAGRRKLGFSIFLIFSALAGAAATFALSGDPLSRIGAIVARPSWLLGLAGALMALLLAWIAVVVGTHASLRRFSNLGLAQRILCAVLVSSLIAMVGIPVLKAGSYALIVRDTVQQVFDRATGGSVGKDGSAPKTKGDPWAGLPRVNVLLIGSDAGADRTGIRPDTLILASIDTKSGNTVLFSLPRNLQRVPFPAGTQQAIDNPDGYQCVDSNGVAQCLLNAFWTFGEENWQTYYSSEPTAFDAGLRATADAVQEVTGLSVNQYAMVDLRGFMQFIDAIGGVNLNVYQRLPIGGSSSHPVATGGWIEPGMNQHMDGYHALWYARSRWSTDDFDRMRRQRCLIAAVVNQADPATVAMAFPQIAAAAKDNIITGIPMNQLPAWVTLTERVKKAKVTSLTFTSKVINTAHPDFEAMRQMVQHAIDPSIPGPTPSTTSPAPTETAEPTPTATDGASPAPSAPPTEDSSGTAQDVNAVC